MSEAGAFAELTYYMKSSTENGTFLFKLSNLHQLYVARLHNLNFNNTVNKTRLKNRIIEYFHGNIQEQTDGRNTFLGSEKDMELLVKDALKE